MCNTCRKKSVESEQLRGVSEHRIELAESEYDYEGDEGEFNEEGEYDDE